MGRKKGHLLGDAKRRRIEEHRALEEDLERIRQLASLRHLSEKEREAMDRNTVYRIHDEAFGAISRIAHTWAFA